MPPGREDNVAYNYSRKVAASFNEGSFIKVQKLSN